MDSFQHMLSWLIITGFTYQLTLNSVSRAWVIPYESGNWCVIGHSPQVVQERKAVEEMACILEANIIEDNKLVRVQYALAGDGKWCAITCNKTINKTYLQGLDEFCARWWEMVLSHQRQHQVPACIWWGATQVDMVGSLLGPQRSIFLQSIKPQGIFWALCRLLRLRCVRTRKVVRRTDGGKTLN